jgi:transcription termination factor Rho
MATDIVTDIERYRSLLKVMKANGDIEFYNKNRNEFNSYNNRFPRFQRDME